MDKCHIIEVVRRIREVDVITQVGGSAIEPSIAGHSDLEMTNQYTFVAPERQNELTRRIQKRLADVTESGGDATQPTREITYASRKLEELASITSNLQ